MVVNEWFKTLIKWLPLGFVRVLAETAKYAPLCCLNKGVVRFPLIHVRPARAENVGAAARAMKSMAFSELRIVDRQVYLDPMAERVAHGATDILADALPWAFLAEAPQGNDVSVASAARSRVTFRYCATPQQVQAVLEEKQRWVAAARWFLAGKTVG